MMNVQNPWFGFSLVTLGIFGAIGFSIAKIPVGTEIFGLITFGFALIQANAHTNAVKQVQELRTMLAPSPVPILSPLPTVDKNAETQPLPLIPTEIRETLIQDPEKVLGKK